MSTYWRIKRRHLVAGLTGAVAGLTATRASAADTIAMVADRVSGSDEARTVALHDFVRDDVAFGWGPRFNNETPSKTLSRGRGFCQTKSMLLTALLGQTGIEARAVFAEIDAGLLRGLLSPGTPMVDHAFVEVRLGGEWVAFDSHVVHPNMVRAAKKRLANEDRLWGWGVHSEGSATFPDWSQFKPGPIRGRIWGPFASVDAFLDGAPKVWNRLPLLVELLFGNFARPANARIDQLVAEGSFLPNGDPS